MAGFAAAGVPMVPGLDGTYQILDVVGASSTYNSGDLQFLTIGGQGAVDIYNSFVVWQVYENAAVSDSYLDHHLGLIDVLTLSCNNTLFLTCQRFGMTHVAFSKLRSTNHRNGFGVLYEDGTPVNMGTGLKTYDTARPNAVLGATATSAAPHRILIPLYMLLCLRGNDGLLLCDNKIEWRITYTTVADTLAVVSPGGSAGVLKYLKPQLWLTRITSERILTPLREAHRTGKLQYEVLGLRNYLSTMTAGAATPFLEWTVNGAGRALFTILRMTTYVTNTSRKNRALTMFNAGGLAGTAGLTGYQYQLFDGTTYPLTTSTGVFSYNTKMTAYDHAPQIKKLYNLLKDFFARPDERMEPCEWGLGVGPSGADMGTSASAAVCEIDQIFPLVFPFNKPIKNQTRINFAGTATSATDASNGRTTDTITCYAGTLTVLPDSQGAVIEGYNPGAA